MWSLRGPRHKWEDNFDRELSVALDDGQMLESTQSWHKFYNTSEMNSRSVILPVVLRSNKYHTYIHTYIPCIQLFTSLDALAKLQQATVSFVMSVRMDQLGFHQTDFREIWAFSKICRENSTRSLKTSDKNKGHFSWRPVHTFCTSPNYS